ncbi:MAG: hypothetical protein ACREOH_11370 [Candidatus Entotheonellia bacterium]
MIVGRAVGAEAWDSEEAKALIVSPIEQPPREVKRPSEESNQR